MLAVGCVSHSYFEFYGNAIEVSLQASEWQDALRYAAGLEAYTAEEPFPWADLQIRRARLLSDVGEDRASPATRQALEALRADCERMHALAALPAIEKALTGIAGHTSAGG